MRVRESNLLKCAILAGLMSLVRNRDIPMADDAILWEVTDDIRSSTRALSMRAASQRDLSQANLSTAAAPAQAPSRKSSCFRGLNKGVWGWIDMGYTQRISSPPIRVLQRASMSHK